MFNLSYINCWCFRLTSLLGLLFLIINLNYWSNPDTSSVYLSAPKIQTFITPVKISPVESFLHQSEKIWRKSIGKRDALIRRKGLTKLNPWFDHDLILWWDYFYPSFNCPHHLERIGKVGDGGKWVCGFSLLENTNCTIYSFGVAQESSFEEEILRRCKKCQIWAYDPSVESIAGDLENDERIHFKKFGLGDETKVEKDVYTLSDLMKQNGHSWIDILKVDVEGWEFRVFNQISKEFEILPFGQLQLEIHVDNFKNFPTFYKWWENLEGKGLRPIFWEPNNYMYRVLKRPVLIEYAFLNVGTKHLVIQ